MENQGGMYLLPIAGCCGSTSESMVRSCRVRHCLTLAHIRLYLQKFRPLKRKEHFYGVTILISFDSS